MSKNKTILIIGAKSDIALAVAHKFASEGYNLQLAARNHSELDVVVDDLKIRYEINLTRSAKDPVMIAGVIIANFIWKIAKRTKGIVEAICLWGALPNSSINSKNV